MRQRILGRTGVEVSEVGFGCGPTAGLMIRGTPEMRVQAVARALDCGINYFDTAPVYGDTVSEANLGHALRRLGVHPMVATKVALEAADFGDLYGAVISSVQASLERLELTRLRLVQLHNRVAYHRAPRGEFGSGALLTLDDILGPRGVLAAFRALRAKGIVEFFGCCAFGGEPALVNQLIDSGEFDTILVNYSLVNATAWNCPPAAQTQIRDYGQAGARAAAAGMGAIALRVLEAGALTDSPQPHPLSGASLNPERELNQARAQALRALPQAESVTDTAIRFALSNPQISTVLIGFSAIEQIEAAAGSAARGALPAETLSAIEDLRQSDFGLACAR
jgi:aryl-alcohol dehydrogenase-like predicted oxidoreductase